MTSSNLKKFLLAGTALVAVSAFAAPASAAVVDHTLSGDATWSSNAAFSQEDITKALKGDNVDVVTHKLTVTNNGTADDNTGDVNSFTLGAVTGTTGTLEITANNSGVGTGLGVTIGSVTLSGAGAITVDTQDAADFDVAVQIDGNVSTGGTLDITNNSDTTANTLGVQIDGTLAVTGASTLKAGAAGAGGSTATLTVDGNSTFTGGMTVTGGGGHINNDATLTLKGATNTGDITLTDGTGQAILVLNGAADQTVAGTIAGNGDIMVTAGGTNDVSFSSDVTSGTVTVNTTGEVEFDGALTSAVTFGAAGTLTLNEDLTGTIAFAGKEGVVVLADGKDITSHIEDGSKGKGTLTVEGASTFAGNIIEIKQINAGATGKTVEFDGTVDATDIKITGTGTVNFDGTVGGKAAVALDFDADGVVTISDNFTGSIDASSDGIGSVTIDTNAADVTGVTTIGATNAIKKLVLANEAAEVKLTASGAINIDYLNVNDNTLTLTGAGYTLTSGQTLSVMATADTASGKVDASGGGLVDLQTGSKVAFMVDETYTPAAGHTYDVVLGNGAPTAVASTVVSYAPGWTFTLSANGNNARLTAATAAITTNKDKVLEQIIATNDGGVVEALQAAIEAAVTTTEKDELIESAQATVDGSSHTSLIDAATAVQGVADTRMASLRTGDTSGMAAGSAAKHGSLWVKGYYSYADQDVRSSIDGYQADTAGVMIGVDRDDLVPGAVIGLAVNYGVTDADSDNANSTNTEIDSYGFTLYGSRDMGNNVFLNGQLGYAFNDIDITRSACGGAGLVCNGDTDSDQLSAKILVGRDYAVQQGATVTPKLYASYVRVDTDGYTETGTGTTLAVQDSDVAALDLGLDVEASWSLKARDGIMKPSINVGYAYDVINDAVEVSSTFTGAGGGAAFKTTGAEPSEHTFNAGLGLVYETDSAWDIAARYDARMKEDYQSHNGMIRVETSF